MQDPTAAFSEDATWLVPCSLGRVDHRTTSKSAPSRGRPDNLRCDRGPRWAAPQSEQDAVLFVLFVVAVGLYLRHWLLLDSDKIHLLPVIVGFRDVCTVVGLWNLGPVMGVRHLCTVIRLRDLCLMNRLRDLWPVDRLGELCTVIGLSDLGPGLPCNQSRSPPRPGASTGPGQDILYSVTVVPDMRHYFYASCSEGIGAWYYPNAGVMGLGGHLAKISWGNCAPGRTWKFSGHGRCFHPQPLLEVADGGTCGTPMQLLTWSHVVCVCVCVCSFYYYRSE